MGTLHLFKHYIRIQFLILGVVEAAGIFLSIFAANYLLFPEGFETKEFQVILGYKATVMTVVVILSFMATGLYQARLREGVLGFGLRFAAAYITAVIAMSVIFYTIPALLLYRAVMALSIVFSSLFVIIVRTVLFLVNPDVFKKRVLILGAGKLACSITELRRKSDQVGFKILGFANIYGEPEAIPADRILNLNMPLLDFVHRNHVDEIVVAVDDRRKGIPMHELLECKMHGVNIIDVFLFFERETGKLRLDQLHPGLLLFSEGFNHSAFHNFKKRTFDILASVFLLTITWPVMLLVALMIWLESGFKPNVSILFRQVRVGESGKPFQMLKFRSMAMDAEKSGKAIWAKENDSRITRVGRFIRKVRIDELPQIYNVLRGDMSFVGPRPERPEFVVMLSEKIPYYSVRHNVKPGITGWAQLLYPYGSSEKDALEKLQFDLYYVKNNSIFLDFLILLQTAEVVLFGRGAR